MYEAYFGLRHSPFLLTPDTDRFVDLPGHRAAFELLTYALDSNEGFVKVTGDVGTGKTMLCRMFVNYLQAPERSAQFHLLYIPNPLLSALGLLRAMAASLGVHEADAMAQPDLFAAVQQRISALANEGRTTLILIDEAQALPTDTLEALRLMSNLETETQKLVQIFLFGQVELDSTLNEFRFRQLKQRITHSYHLPTLEPERVQLYLNQRLQLAGREGAALFNASLASALYRLSRGVPRLLNILAHKVLLSAYASARPMPVLADVQAAQRDSGLKPLRTPTVWPLALSGGLMLAAALWLAQQNAWVWWL
ncbi:ExeA family protein [Salinispirillum marinum]|uniref:ExeA family protein n=2 Tax=Saccharospirillaceae TaxID=255527 RepID=A0ABV8BB05_9GAMM